MTMSLAIDGVLSVVTMPVVEWGSFLEGFGRRHRAWLASVTLNGCYPDDVVRMTFLNGISLCARRPLVVRVQHTDDGAERALEIEAADDGFIRLAFRATELPEQVDGLAPAEDMVAGSGVPAMARTA